MAIRSELLVQDIGEKEKNIMRKKIDSDMPIGEMARVNDFLPPPSKLVIPEQTVKVTLSLKRSSVEFFRRQAQRHHTKYQKMIRELLDRYVIQYS